MEQNFFINLPSELITNILSLLPLRSNSISKCVCKPWLNLIDSDDFPKSNPPALARLIATENNSIRCTISEFEDEDEADAESHVLHPHPLTDLEIPYENSAFIHQSRAGNGLLLLQSSLEPRIYICNPITREYIAICCPGERSAPDLLSFGFGVSKLSGQFKVVCVNGSRHDPHFVYTLGTGTWRRIEPDPTIGCVFSFNAYVECNGNLHWTLYDSANIYMIGAFDLETERVSIFSAPKVDGLVMSYSKVGVVVLNVWRDSLVLSYKLGRKMVFWLMKEYQVEESWTIIYQISLDFDKGIGVRWYWTHVYPIKLFENGDVLMLMENMCLIYYSNKTRTIRQINTLMDGTSKNDMVSVVNYTPSLFSLKNFGVENVISF